MEIDEEILADDDPVRFYYNLTPNSGGRCVSGYLSADDALIQQRAITLTSQPLPGGLYSSGTISIEQSMTGDSMKPKTAIPGYYMMMQLDDISAAHSVMNISDLPYMRNNTFWVWEDWGGVVTDATFDSIILGTFSQCIIPNGSYIASTNLLAEMNKLNTAVTFDYTPSTRLKYTGTKPLILPLTPTFSLETLKTLTSFVIEQTNDYLVPSNVTDITTPTSASQVAKATYTTKINGVTIPLSYETPEYPAYSLLYKLGFLNPYGDNQRPYFTYNMKNSPISNTSAPSVVPSISGAGESFVIIYPNAEASSNGNMLGPQQRMSIVCDECEFIGDFQPSLATLPISSTQPFTLYNYAMLTNSTNLWQRLKPGAFKRFNIRLVDDYQNPYYLMIGPPQVRLIVQYRQSCT